jgi:TRAP-type mannitol/chloroaromatic compound transport system permease small subunit
MIIKLAMPLVINAYVTKEMSSNAGGLIRWPVYR